MPSAEQQRHTRVPSDISWSTGFHLIAPIPCRQASCVLPKIASRETASRARPSWSTLTQPKAATQTHADPLRAVGARVHPACGAAGLLRRDIGQRAFHGLRQAGASGFLGQLRSKAEVDEHGPGAVFVNEDVLRLNVLLRCYRR